MGTTDDGERGDARAADVPALRPPPTPVPGVAETRRAQTFPVLTPDDVDRIRRFGEPRRWKHGERLFEAGKTGPGMFVVLSGRVAVSRQVGLHGRELLLEQGPGEFLAEVGQLSGAKAFVDGDAVGEVEAILVPPAGLRALLVAEAELGERIMRALILRRVALIQSGSSGPVLIGGQDLPGVVRIQNFLGRNGWPHQLLDPATDPEAAELIARYAAKGADLPLVVALDGSVLRNPSEEQLARALELRQRELGRERYDVAVVGAGPAGLATSVYAASEGLSVLVLDARAFGGQAGASARIENYFGFPTGITGMALTGRGFTQAQKFGVEMAIPSTVASLVCGEEGVSPDLTLLLDDGRRVRARTLVVASGARYRRPDVPDLARFEGRGVSYWATPVEARSCSKRDVVLVGGGNSAGQAAVFMSGHARTVHMLVRGPGLAATMSRYLIDRIEATPNIRLHPFTELVALEGDDVQGITAVRWRERRSSPEERHEVAHVFLFIGADPATEWLRGCPVALDAKGFLRTGGDLTPAELAGRSAPPAPLETTVPGVFAVGDVRSGSVKRVGGAIGEGAAVVAQIHAYLAARDAEDVGTRPTESSGTPPTARAAP